MQQREFTSIVSEMTGMSKVESKKAVDTTFQVLGQIMAQGDRLVVPQFGVFCTKRRPKRIRRHPRTHEPLFLPADTVPIFKPSNALKQLVNNSGPGP